MRQFKVQISGIAALFLFFSVLFISCQQDNCKGVFCTNGGVCQNGNCRCPSGFGGPQCQFSVITFWNNSYTDINISIKVKNVKETKIVPAFSTLNYYGSPGDTAVYKACTYGPTGQPASSLNPVAVGDTIFWNDSTVFAKTGTRNINFDVGQDYFFLKIQNSSYVYQITSVNVLSDTLIHNTAITVRRNDSFPVQYVGYYYFKPPLSVVTNLGTYYPAFYPAKNFSVTVRVP